MNNNETIQRFIFGNASVRGELFRIDRTFQTIMEQHKYPPIIRQILGEILVVAGLLTASIKFKGRLTVQFQGPGKVKLLLAQCNNDYQLRGLAQWTDSLEKDELIANLQQGTLAIIMDSEERGGTRYQGLVAFKGESLAESVEEYFAKSEQIPTRLWLAVNEHRAGGLLIQTMPNEMEKLGKKAYQDPDWNRIVLQSTSIKADDLLKVDNEFLLQTLYPTEEIQLFSPIPVSFGCTCSVARGEKALMMLGKKEVEEELHEKQKIIVSCEFCSKEYIFDRVDAARIFSQGSNPDSSTRH